MDTAAISNRHSLAADGLAEVPLRLNQSVQIVVADAWASASAGQLLVSCLVNLLCRQARLIRSINVVARSGPKVIRLPNENGAKEFPGCLVSLTEWAVRDAVTCSVSNACQGAVDWTIVVGDGCDDASADSLFVVGTGWRAWVGALSVAPKGVVPAHENPLGPFLAAALAAGEVFKRIRGIRRGRLLSEDGYSLWSGRHSARWSDLEDGPDLVGQELPALHVIGAGAVGNGLCYILANMKSANGYAAIIDDDTYDDTSLNRCTLAGWRDVGHPKVDALSRVLRAAAFGTFRSPHTISGYLESDREGLRPDMAEQANDLSFNIVVSCVDRGISRQDVQGLAPRLLVGGSTLGLAARANHYPDRSGAACLACFNPAERDGEKIRAMERRLWNMPVKERTAFLLAHEIDATAVEAWLTSAQCGSLGEAAIKDLATRVPSEFSVGFISLGAALLLGSMLLRLTLFRKAEIERGDMYALNFLNGGAMDSFQAPDSYCEWECQKRRAQPGRSNAQASSTRSTAA